MPAKGKKRGRLSYTIDNPSTGAKVEVLLKGKAFRIIKMSVVDQNGIPTSLILYFSSFPKVKKIQGALTTNLVWGMSATYD